MEPKLNSNSTIENWIGDTTPVEPIYKVRVRV